jgi:hypothetical protein
MRSDSVVGKQVNVIPVLALLFGLMGHLAAHSQGCEEYGDFMRPTWGMDTSNNNQTKGGCFTGDYLLLAEGWEGLRIVQLAEQSPPEIVGSLELPGFCRDVAVAGDIAYVITGSGGWYIIDFSNPGLPVLLETREASSDGMTAKTAGNLLFLLFDGWGAIIHDLSDPADPVYLGGLFGGDPVDITLDGHIAYLATTGTLYIFDITNPVTPVELGHVNTADRATGIARSGSLVYVAVDYHGLEVFDVSDSTNPTSLGVTATRENASDVAALDELVFVTLQYFGIQAFDAADPANLEPLWSMDTWGSSERAVLDGNRLCTLEAFAGFHMLDVSTPAIEAGARQATPGALLGAAFHDQHCFVAEGDLGMQVFDVSNPENPQSVQLYSTPDPVAGIMVADGIAYLIDAWSGIRLVDVSDPAAPFHLGWINALNNPRDMFLHDDLLFIADYSNGLIITDVSDPTAPQFVGRGDTPDWAYGVDVEGDYAFLADNTSGLQVLDISSPGNPVTVGSVALADFAMDVEVVGHLAYVPINRRGLAIIDVTLPTAPVEIQRVSLPNDAVAIKISGSVAYVACTGGGLVLVDISDTANARAIGCLPSRGSTNDLALSDTHVFLADGEGGLAVTAKQCVEATPVFDSAALPGSTRLDGVYPNPLNPRTIISFTMVEAGPMSLRVFDLAGRLVRVLEEGVRGSRSHQVVWDGRDDAGRMVASAPYIVRLQAGGVEENKKVLLVR